MAKGLQRKIEYSDLKFISSFAMEKFFCMRSENSFIKQKRI